MNIRFTCLTHTYIVLCYYSKQLRKPYIHNIIYDGMYILNPIYVHSQCKIQILHTFTTKASAM